MVIIIINCFLLILLLLFIYFVDLVASFTYWVTYFGGADFEDLCYVFWDCGVFDEGVGDGGLRRFGDCVGCVSGVFRIFVGEVYIGEVKRIVYLVEEDVLKFVDIII